MLNQPFSPWPSYSQEEADAVSRVLLSNRVNYWTGTECREFEKAFAAFSDARHAIAVANGTVALDLALYGLGIGDGDEVIVPPRTFLATASAVVNAGATPVFADIDRDSQNITAATIAPLINDRTRAIICVHLAGWPCDMDEIVALARRHGLFVIEDCAQAHGARYRGQSVGALGDVGCWSFCQDKIMTTGGEGGMVTTNDDALWARMWSFKDHGKGWQAVYERQHPPGFRWLHETIGTNWRMTELQGVIGRIQLERMPQWHRARTQHASRILDCAASLPGLRVARPPAHAEHAWYKCYVFLDPAGLAPGWSRERVMDEIIARGVPCYTGSCSEVYLEKAFVDRGLAPAERLPAARELGETAMLFLVHPTLTDQEIAKTCDVLADVMHLAAPLHESSPARKRV